MRLSGSLIVAAPLALILSTGAARADLTEEAKRVEDALFALLSDTERYKGAGTRDGFSDGPLHTPPVDCAALVEQGKKAGIAPGDKLRGYPDPYLFKRAPELVCAEYTKWRLLGEAHALFKDAAGSHSVVQSITPGSVTGEWAMAYDVKGKECHATVEKLITRGLVTDVPLPGWDSTVAALRATYCQGLVDWAKQFAVATEAVREAEIAALRGKYAKLGAKGDRLEYLMDADRRTLYGKGCGEVDLKGRAKSAVLYEVWEDDAKWTVWKTTFKKDKKVGSKSKNFSKHLVSDWRCW